jgi:hypothetical protein
MPDFFERPHYESYFLMEGHYLGLRFDTGFVFVRILGRERSVIKPFDLGSAAALSAQTTFNTINNSQGQSMLDPGRAEFIYQIFTGIKPSNARLYINYPSGAALMSLAIGSRPVPAATPNVPEQNIGYVDAGDSPFENPSVATELFTVWQLYPEYKIFNPTQQNFPETPLHFPIMKYTYRLILDANLAKQFIDGTRRCRFYSMGGTQPTSMPQWLATKDNVVALAKQTQEWAK